MALVLFGLAPNAGAENHGQRGQRAQEGRPNSNAKNYRIDDELVSRANNPSSSNTTKVIVELQPGQKLPASLAAYLRRRGQIKMLNGHALELPDRLIKQLAADPAVLRMHHDRAVAAFNYRTSLTVGTRVVQETLGLTGAGVVVAVIDSGISSWHDDLTSTSATLYPYGNQRVTRFVDFVNGQTAPYDDNGHGTHVSGIIAGNGFDSNGRQSGAAPDASLISLKVLDAEGNGTVSSTIAALDWVLANHATYNIRVVNMSVGSASHESAWTDPLTLAAKRVVDAGVVVVAAAGNFGRNSAGLPQYGGINAPGNAPWVLTVGGSSTNGTARRTDDTIGTFSSRGPTYIDWIAKPDLVAPGAGTVSLAAANSTFYQTRPLSLLSGEVATAVKPYLSLTGTSMAAPVVAGTVALMLQANPSLTPNAVKAILQYTAQQNPGYNALTQGAGFLNAVGAVRLSRFSAHARLGERPPSQRMWSRQLIWGNHRLGGGALRLTANAFKVGTTWGVAKTDAGDNIVWGTSVNGDNIIWGTSVSGDNIAWGTDAGDNIVWGTDCGGADCDNVVWGSDAGDNIVWGTASAGDNIVWGTDAGDNIVWGTDAGDNIVWGTDAGDNIVWGTDAGDNIVWGTDAGDNIVWGTDAGDNIVWGTDAGDNIVWGTSAGDNIVWGTAGSLATVWISTPAGTRTPLNGHDVFDLLKDRTLLRLLQYAPRPGAPPPALPPAAPPVVANPIVVTAPVVTPIVEAVPVVRISTMLLRPMDVPSLLPGGGF